MTRSLQPAWFLLVVSWACLLTPMLSAQPAEHVTLTGTVVDEETEVPLIGVHVFIATSMIGTTTDREGAFRLEDVPIGAHRLVLSMVGFFSETHDLMLRAAPGAPLEFQLQPTVVEVGEVTVTATHNRLKAFQGSPRHFLLTLLDSTNTDTGFTAYHVSTFAPSATAGKPRFLVKPTDFVSAGATQREYILDFDDYLEVIYTEERGSEQG